MNVERLYDTLNATLALEDQLGLQHQLHQLRDVLASLTDSPASPELQSNVASQIEAALRMVVDLKSRLSPAQYVVLKQIGGDQFFDERVVDNIKDIIQSNAMTPAVVRDKARSLAATRLDFIDTLKALLGLLTKLGIKGETLAAGEVELSVLLPRPLFHDELRELANELITLSSMIKPFSEIATGQVEKVRVDQISTSDPTFFLGLDVETVKLIGQAVISITTLITSLLALRKGKEQAKTNNAPIEFIEWHDRQMQAIMRDGIAQHATELASQSNKAFERQNELQIELVKAMTKMAERIEVGVQIGIVVSGQPPEEADDRRATAFQTAKELSQKIEHPRLVGAPVLALTTREEAANETEAPKHSD